MSFYPFNMPLALILPARTASFLIAIILPLSGCSVMPYFSGPSKPQPAALQPVSGSVVARQAWVSRIGPVNFPLDVQAIGDSVFVAGGDGSLASIDGRTGADLWRANAGAPIAAGIGTDGKTSAVVTQANEAVAFLDGREIWRQKLTAQAYTAPFVAGGRVFILTADRAVSAYDGQTGRKLWTQLRPNEPLVLRQSGVMLAVGDTLVVGLGGRLAGLNPSSGSIRWEAPIASSCVVRKSVS